MNYEQTLAWMFRQLPMYQKQGTAAYKKDLHNTILFSEHLHYPEKKLNTIHIAGTNGKGSTSHMVASIVQEAGYKVGLYTSPHLKDFRERIKINGKKISKTFVCQFINNHLSFFEKHRLSFFEMTVGLAFDYFATEKVDIAIIEAGLGGRLDSTNIITPLLSVITNIGLDHTQLLGNTLQAIALEKAGIIKLNTPVVIGEYTPETKPIFMEKAHALNAPIYFASSLTTNSGNTKPHEESNTDYESPLKGNYQKQNKNTALQSIFILQTLNKYNITDSHIKNGFINVIKNTGLQGRWEQLQENPKVICDTAHNEHGLKIVMNQISEEYFETLHIVLGVVNDKNLDDVLPLFPKKAMYYFCSPKIERGLDVVVLKNKANEYGLIGNTYSSVKEAYKKALNQAKKSDFIYIGGSTFVVAEIL